MNDDDPTQSFPDNDKTTQPTLGAILDHVRGFETRVFQHLQLMESRFDSQIASLRDEVTAQTASLRSEMTALSASLRAELTAQIASLRDEMNSGFRLVANKIEVLSEDSLSLRASQRELLKRMGELETRAS